MSGACGLGQCVHVAGGGGGGMAVVLLSGCVCWGGGRNGYCLGVCVGGRGGGGGRNGCCLGVCVGGRGRNGCCLGGCVGGRAGGGGRNGCCLGVCVGGRGGGGGERNGCCLGVCVGGRGGEKWLLSGCVCWGAGGGGEMAVVWMCVLGGGGEKWLLSGCVCVGVGGGEMAVVWVCVLGGGVGEERWLLSYCLGVCHNTKCQWRRHCQPTNQPTNQPTKPKRVQPDTERVWRGHVYVVCTELGVVLLSGCLSQHKVSLAAALPTNQPTSQLKRVQPDTERVGRGHVYVVCTELGVVLLSGRLSQSVSDGGTANQPTNQPSRSAFSQTRNMWGGDTCTSCARSSSEGLPFGSLIDGACCSL